MSSTFTLIPEPQTPPPDGDGRLLAEQAALLPTPQRTGGHGPASIEDQLFNEPFIFDFFQAVRIMERLDPTRKAVGRNHLLASESVRFKAHLSLSFPPSQIFDIVRPVEELPTPAMTVAFFGLFGPSGILPRHYSEQLMRIDREAKHKEKHALRAWLDLFNHRLISLFYRAWEKYRFYIPYERKEYDLAEPDAFTRTLFSLVGLGTPRLRNRLRVSTLAGEVGWEKEEVLQKIDDLVLLHYSGLFAHRRPLAVGLEAILQDYFQLGVRVIQFQGQWLSLDRANQSRIGAGGANNEMGINLVAGERVWDVQGKIRLRLGPLNYDQFCEFLPDRAPTAERKLFFVLLHLVRLYVGPEFDFDVQLVLQRDEVPWCQLVIGDEGSSRLGWNTWLRSKDFERDADEAVFQANETVFVNSRRPRQRDTASDERTMPRLAAARGRG